MVRTVTLLLFLFGLNTKLTYAQWSLTGNGVASTQFLGTTNNETLKFRTANVERMRLHNNGLSIGTLSTYTNSRLTVSQTEGNYWLRLNASTESAWGLKYDGSRLTWDYLYSGPGCFGCSSMNNILSITSFGQVNVGLSSTDNAPSSYKLVVKGGILATRLKVAVYNSTDWADYVFQPNYELMPLTQLANFIVQYKHLPNIPSAEQVVQQGIDVAVMDAKLLAKIEELTLYMIQLQQENQALSKEIEQTKQQIKH